MVLSWIKLTFCVLLLAREVEALPVLVGSCPAEYTQYGNSCYKYVVDNAFFFQAYGACRKSSNGWLAALNAEWKLGLVNHLNIQDDAWFGLLKTSFCTGSSCQDKHFVYDRQWKSPVYNSGNYTLNMDRLASQCNCCLITPLTFLSFLIHSGQPGLFSFFYISKTNQKWRSIHPFMMFSYICETFPATPSPTAHPTTSPTAVPSQAPSRVGDSIAPTRSPTLAPTMHPTTRMPTFTPTVYVPPPPGCPPTYTLYSTGCYKYVANVLSRSAAATACSGSESGWLANLNEEWKLSIPTALGVTTNTWFGLFRTTSCFLWWCNHQFQWSGVSPPTDGYSLYMDRYIKLFILLFSRIIACL